MTTKTRKALGIDSILQTVVFGPDGLRDISAQRYKGGSGELDLILSVLLQAVRDNDVEWLSSKTAGWYCWLAKTKQTSWIELAVLVWGMSRQ